MSSKRSFLKEIHAHIGSLLEKHRFSLLEEKEEPEHFGNAFAKFGSPSILLRIAKAQYGARQKRGNRRVQLLRLPPNPKPGRLAIEYPFWTIAEELFRA